MRWATRSSELRGITWATDRALADRGAPDLSTHEIITGLRARVLIIHGTDDGKVPLWMAEKNIAARNDVEHLLVDGAGHSGSSRHEDYDSAIIQILMG